MKHYMVIILCSIIAVLPCLADEKSKDTLDTTIPHSVTYIEFIARANNVGINYEPILFYDSTAFFGAGVRGGLQIGLGTTLPVPFFGVRFDVPIVPIIVIGKEYGAEIGAGLDFQWWVSKAGFNSESEINSYNSLKLTGLIGYRHYFFGMPHHLFRIGFTTTRQADGYLQVIYYFSFGI